MNERPRHKEEIVFVSDLHLQARVGVNPGEQTSEQPIVVDIWVGMENMMQAARSEKLQDTLDYVGIARKARKVVEREHYPLVETLATSIARELLVLPLATWVRVRLRKLHCLRRASAAGVEVELTADRCDLQPVFLRADQVADVEDVVIVGGGATGLSAALWCWQLGHPALLVDPSPALGGQLHLIYSLMTDLPGMDPMPGLPLIRRLVRQFMGHDGRWLRARLVRALPGGAGGRQLLEMEGVGKEPGLLEIRTRATILAMGARRRVLGVHGEQELLGRGILTTAAQDTRQQAGQQVVVVGGGDAACENALMLSEADARVTLVCRGPRLSALRRFCQAVAEHPEIDLRLQCRVLRFLGEGSLEGVEVLQRDDQGEEAVVVLPADAALIRAGWVPNTEVLDPGWLHRGGFVQVDNHNRVSAQPGFYAAGDITGPLSASVAHAFGSGSTAARAAAQYLEAGTNPP